ncbi:MAG: hypothetical protein M0D53_08155 [Flavobacterium sp. JAD_PAG50586_2]|nr:MAG: hypothetical protein M0D53_08155 [Flavobacterium sp. JAD_PAG50586_2]
MMNKSLYKLLPVTTITILMLLLSFPSFSQKKLKGKTFSALYSTVKTKTEYGGKCMIYTYCSLKFDKNTVTVSFNSEADCKSSQVQKEVEKSSEQTYEWYTVNKQIHIKDFNGFEPLSFSDGKLVGKKLSSDKSNTIEFHQEP